jgi:hypothetical protein
MHKVVKAVFYAHPSLRAGVSCLLSVTLCACHETRPGTVVATEAGDPVHTSSMVRPGPTASPVIGDPLDVGDVIRRVHFAYRKQASGYEGAHSTYRIAVDARGRLSYTPFHHEPTSSAGSRAPSDGHTTLSRAVRQGRALILETRSIRRDQELLRDRAPAIADEDGGVLRLQRPIGKQSDREPVVERLRNGEAGVEQSWRFAQRPEGRGDLVVIVRSAGLPYSGQTKHGPHFFDATTKLGVRYGNATWIDAKGRRHPIATRFVGHDLVLRVPTAVVDASPYPALLDPVISGEIIMDSAVSSPAIGTQSNPSLAYDSTNGNYLIVWQDTRGADKDIYGTRFSFNASPQILDRGGLAISSAVDHQTGPEVAFNATAGNFLVVWQDFRLDPTISHIYGARVSSAGSVLDPNGIVISSVAYQQQSPRLAAGNADRFLVVWSHQSASGGHTWDAHGARIDGTTGAVLDAAPGIVISAAGAGQRFPGVSWDGTNWYVAWADGRNGIFDIYGSRVDPNGTVLEPTGTEIARHATDERYLDLAYAGGYHFMVWHRDENPDGVYGARVGSDGVLADTPATNGGIAIAASPAADSRPRVVAGNNQFLVTWSHGTNDIYGTRVATSGTVLDTPFPIANAANTQQFSNAAFDGTNYFVTWQDDASKHVHGTRVNTSAAIVDTPAIVTSISNNDQTASAIAFDGTNYLVVWSDSRNDDADVYSVRFSTTGTALDVPAIAIARVTGKQALPAVAAGGGNFLIAWQDSRQGNSDIYSARLSSAGALLDPVGTSSAVSTLAGSAQTSPTVSYNGAGDFLVAWEDARSGTSIDIYGARVALDGTLRDGPAASGGIPIAIGAASDQQPALAWGGSQFLAVWQTNLGSFDIHGVALSSAGTPIGASFAISSHAATQTNPAVVYSGTNFFVAWSDTRSNVSDIYGARVSPTGVVLDPSGIQLSSGTGAESNPTLSYDGNSVLVAWEDERTGTTNKDVYGTWVDRLGLLSHPQGFSITNLATAHELAPAVACASPTLCMTSYHFLDAATAALRVSARMLTSTTNGNGAACLAGHDCTSTFCIDGVCCNSACGDGDPSDCQACSIAKGSAVDGSCLARPLNTICRAATGDCDAAEKCNGVATTCPADGPKLAGVPCRAATDVCDQEEVCDGQNKTCPADGVKVAGSQCRAKTGDCDVAEACDGQSATCPANSLASDGTSCNDSDLCTSSDSCSAGTCAGTPITCTAPDECHLAGACEPATGKCSHPAKPDGTPCSLGVCLLGACSPQLADGAADLALADSGADLPPDGAADAPAKDAALVADLPQADLKGTPDFSPDGGAPKADLTDLAARDHGRDGAGDSEPVAPQSTGCGCAVNANSRGVDLGGALLLGALIVYYRRRCRRRPAPTRCRPRR